MTSSNYEHSGFVVISHRGNLVGVNRVLENSPDYIMNAVHEGFDVEIDVWHVDNKYYLGHDSPQHEVEEDFLLNSHFWLHAKSVETLARLSEISYPYNFFFHDTDQATLTSKGHLWLYPGTQVFGDNSIVVLPEKSNEDYHWHKALGVCTDQPIKYKNLYLIEQERQLESVIKEIDAE